MTPRVLIVGAGIGGLGLAQALIRTGMQVKIIEKVACWRPVGAGLILSGNALRVMNRLGLSESLMQVGHPLAAASLTDAGGRLLQTISYGASGGAVALRRADLQAVLSQGLTEQIYFATTLQALHQTTEGVDVTLSDESAHQFDVVVGADGLHSAVRHLVFGDLPKQYAGYTSWRFVVSSSGPQHAVEMWGRGCRLGLVPLGGGQTYGYVTANALEGQSGDSLNRAAEVRARCTEFGGVGPELLSSLQTDIPVIRTDIHEVHLPRWVQGRVALLGDAAHAMTPNLGQGAAMSLEDAWVLGQQLKAAPNVPAALARYEALRRRRVNQVQTASHFLGRVGQLEADGLRRLRDVGMRLTPPLLARWSTSRLFQTELD
ncbi:FAD-dependent monooxygenase [Deinococcus sp. QL22]|uniref:FAD-dependent monooxygenase n=1 Tax=Deinococcus sp. QL22 TaxID=2939437 RepID=UPI002017D533|nr:FAD-dependent monooxygenase [Deinococcus sp. QL22]UQN08979.1 FAD-dependent monooxygenase [Deinococcus sp. QL22]